MNLLCWNCWGLGNLPTEQELGDLIRAQDPSVVFLAETWLDKARLEDIRIKLNFGGMIEVCREMRGGGIVIFWKKEIDFSLGTFSPNHIDGIMNKGKEDEWRFTGFYGESETANHHLSWSCLRSLKRRNSIPWLCAGDFNEITRSHEKVGGRQRPARQMEDFREVLDECSFRDLGFVGGKFTWCNGHPNGFTIWERLDRVVATIEWLDKFPATKVVHLECGSSDHKPILICLNGIPKPRNKPWRFEHMWLEEEGCRDTVESAWLFDAPGQAMSRVEGKISHCQAKLKWWSRIAIGNITRLLKEKKELLRKAEEVAIAGGSINKVLRLKKEINDLLSKEEKMWKQRSRALWLHEVDNNTRYFHSRATHRFRRNRIEVLEDDRGERCVDENGIANILVDFYQNLFASSSPSQMEEALEATPLVVTEEMNLELMAPFEKAEVDMALKQMDPLKAPGPDGMPPLFFQQF